MQVYAPHYYPKFSCIGGACRHNCCIGWEIDVDRETYARYQKVDGALGGRLRKHLALDGDGAHFILGENDRCPFLNSDNLCDIILTMGEEALCRICTDHPRYRTFYESRTEIGLGLCCEAACELILGQKEKPEFVCVDGDGAEECTEEEKLFFHLRDSIVETIFRSKSVEACMEEVGACYGIILPDGDWTAVYAGLEILHPDWRERIKRLSASHTVGNLPLSAVKQLLAYFICRHLGDGLLDGRYRTRIAFALHATKMILRLADTYEELLDAARQYSEEIEYSAENMDALFALLEQ